jgi:hypothetical protein
MKARTVVQAVVFLLVALLYVVVVTRGQPAAWIGWGS